MNRKLKAIKNNNPFRFNPFQTHMVKVRFFDEMFSVFNNEEWGCAMAFDKSYTTVKQGVRKYCEWLKNLSFKRRFKK